MYLRGIHAEAHIPALQQLIRENPLGILTTAIRSPQHPFIQASHIPFVLDVPENADGTLSNGILRGHLAKQNPQAKVLMEAAAARKEQGHDTHELLDEVLVLQWTTPPLYSGKVVPTWNYSAVEVYGKVRVYCDSKSSETSSFLQKQLGDLTRQSESLIMGYTGGDKSSPWEVSDAPAPYIGILQKNIIGIEIRIDRLGGKFKMSQEMSKGDREGVINGFNNLGTEAGEGIAKTVGERGQLKDSHKRE